MTTQERERILERYRIRTQLFSSIAADHERRVSASPQLELPEPSSSGTSLSGDDGGLSQRELEVLTLLAHGDHNGEIAERLIISEETVKSHVKRIIFKLHARNRTHAVMIAAEQRLLPIGPVS